LKDSGKTAGNKRFCASGLKYWKWALVHVSAMVPAEGTLPKVILVGENRIGNVDY